LSAVSTPIFASKYSLESSSRDLQDLHAFAPLRPQYFNKIWSFFSVFNIINAKKFAFFIVTIFADVNEICSDSLENAEKRCNFSKLLYFNLIFIMIIPEIYLIFDLIFTEPPHPNRTRIKSCTTDRTGCAGPFKATNAQLASELGTEFVINARIHPRARG